MGLKEDLKLTSPTVYIIVVLFGMSSWLDINGIFVELPLMVSVLPEGWALPSYIVLIIQIANIGPILYTIAYKLTSRRIKEWPVIYLIIAIGAISCLLLAFFWDYTSYIGGEERSTGLLSLSAILALVDCTSSVVYLPYMSYFKQQYLTAFYIGEGFSGLVPGLLGLAQGVGGEPVCVNTSMNDNGTDWALIPEYPPARFSVDVFYFCLSALMCISGVAFTFLHFAPFCVAEKLKSNFELYTNPEDKDRVNNAFEGDESKDTEIYLTKASLSITLQPIPDEKVKVTEGSGTTVKTYDACQVVKSKHITKTKTLSKFEFILLLTYLGFVNAMTNGVLPSTLSYSCLPYGNQAYGLASRLSLIANPLACFLALFIPTISITAISIVTFLGTLMTVYQLYLAAVSPFPPLQDEVSGVVLVVLTYTLLIGLFSFVKVSVAIVCRDDGGRHALLWCGGVTQIGSFLGAIVSFICVNVLELFESAPACPTVANQNW